MTSDTDIKEKFWKSLKSNYGDGALNYCKLRTTVLGRN